MTKTTIDNNQIIYSVDEQPLFVMVPYAAYLKMREVDRPSAVVDMVMNQNFTAAKAWRKYKRMTQEDVASKLAITQPSYAVMESRKVPTKKSLERIASVLGISYDQINFNY